MEPLISHCKILFFPSLPENQSRSEFTGTRENFLPASHHLFIPDATTFFNIIKTFLFLVTLFTVSALSAQSNPD